MQREILFRGKMVSNGEWVYGYFFKTEEGFFVGPYNEEAQVIPETVGQFIGLKDKNGIEIYEGDVVLWDGRKAVIEWLPRMAGWFAMWKGEGVHFHEQQQIVPTHRGLRHVEIINTIHDNPELVKPAVKDGFTNTMNTNYDPGTKTEEAASEAAETVTETTQEAQQESAEEGTTEG